ncbi:hypothetical protein [Luteimonas aquatica]|uniref:hypothetical protein n=1 Tax=Luteimonas aquatica TaxID=450364 RepID=UPI001F5A3E0F|nr:hypothetical protein [Luteimonas aquatica]
MHASRAARLAGRMLCALAIAGVALAHAQDAGGDGGDAANGFESRDVVIYLEAVPGNLPLGQPWTPPIPGKPYTTAMGKPVKLRGVAALALAGKTLSITVTSRQAKEPPGPPDQGCPAGTRELDTGAQTMSDQTRPQPPTTLQARIANSGTFETVYTPIVTGTHSVVATLGADRGKTEFDVAEPPGSLCEPLSPTEIAQDAKQVAETAYQALDLVEQRIATLPDSPAKDEFKRKLGTLRKTMESAQPRGQAPGWVKSIEPFNRLRSLSPRIRKAAEPLGRQLREWQAKAKQSNGQARQALARLQHGNVVCDQLDVVINALKFVDFSMGLLATPAELIKGWLVENVPTKLVGQAMGTGRMPPAIQQTIESTWKLCLTSVDGWAGLALPKVVNDLVGYASNRYFDKYCQAFTGPVSGSMYGVVSKAGTPWWKFRIRINGQLILRYPRHAAGAAIALSGELIGNASQFKSKDRAIQVLFPKFAKGVAFSEVRVEPLANPLNDGDYSGWDPGSIMIDKGGTMARSLAPAFFRIPVRGDLRGDRLRIELQPAVMDFKDEAATVRQVALSPLSPIPNVIVYDLPYPGAFTIFQRAFNDGPAEFAVTRVGARKDILQIKQTFARQRDRGKTHGEYSVDVLACNPACP